jgi:hypothetical protein
VTVPDGGIKGGQQFEVPYPTDTTFAVVSTIVLGDEAMIAGDAPIVASTINVGNEAMLSGDAPTGRWRTELCDCSDTCCCPWWVSVKLVFIWGLLISLLCLIFYVTLS